MKFRLRDLLEVWRSRRAISVRSAAVNRQVLWFHITGVPLTLLQNGYSLENTLSRLDDVVHNEGLTGVGKSITSQILALNGVVGVDVRPDYICVRVDDELRWHFVLTIIVNIIRRSHPKGYVPVRVRPHFDPREANWQHEMLSQIYSGVQPPQGNVRLRKHVMHVFSNTPSYKLVSSHEILHRLPWHATALYSGGLHDTLEQLVSEGTLEVRPVVGEKLYSNSVPR